MSIRVIVGLRSSWEKRNGQNNDTRGVAFGEHRGDRLRGFGESHVPGDVSNLLPVLSARGPLTPDLAAPGRGSTALVLAQAPTTSAGPAGVVLDAGTHKFGEGNAQKGSTPDPNATPFEFPPPATYVHIGGAGEEGEDLWVPNAQCHAAVGEALERHASVGVADQTCAAIMQKALAIQREHPERPPGRTPEFRETPGPPPGFSSNGP
jgi:hypothetical protein